MTLINPTSNGATTTGREFEDFILNLEETRANAEDMRSKAKTMEEVAKASRWALEQVSEVEDQATEFLNTIRSMDFSLKIAEKVGPLRLPARFVDDVLDQLEDVATAIRNRARSLERKIEEGEYIEKLQRAEDRLSEVQDGIEVVEGKLEQYGAAASTMLFAFDLVGEPLDPLENAGNSAATPVNDILVPINRTYNEIEELFDGLTGSFESAEAGAALFDGLRDVARDFGKINGSLSFLKGPLEAIQSALSPVEWVLDAVGFIYDITVGPVIDFLLDKLGVTDVMNEIGRRIATLLPDVDVLNQMDVQFDATLEQIESFIDGWNTRIDEYVDDITTDVVEGLQGLAPDALRFGTEGRDVIEGRTSDLDLLNGLDGNDSLYGYAQADGPGAASAGDLFIASSGDDFNYGGAGTDWLILRGRLEDYRISQFSDSAPVVFFDQLERWGREVADGIEHFVFTDGVYTIQALRDLGVLSPAATPGPDLILGGDDDDVIAPLGGSDSIDGGAGIDTYLVPITDNSGSQRSVDLNRVVRDAAGRDYSGTAWDGFTRDYIDNIENIIIEPDRDAQLVGTQATETSSGANVLISGDGDDFLQGLSGDDMLFGSGGRDVLIGGAGQDRVYGGSENDLILGGPAAPGRGEYYDGGEGTFDRLVYSTNRSEFDLDYNGQQLRSDALEAVGSLRIDGRDGTAQHMQGDSVVATDRFTGFENVVGSDANDTIFAAPNEDRSVRSSFYGAGGDDVIYTGDADSIFGGQGSDTIILTEGGSDIDGGSQGSTTDILDMREFSEARVLIRNSFNERVFYTGFADFEVERLGDRNGFVADRSIVQLFSGTFQGIELLLLSDQDDEFYAFGTSDIEIFGAGGNDRFVRNMANDGGAGGVYHGGDGNDYFEFNGEGNEAHGDAGDDRMLINSSEDGMELTGGEGDDFVRVTRARGTAHGGDGYDKLSLEPRFNGTRSEIDLLTGIANVYSTNTPSSPFEIDYIRLTGVQGFEEIIGGEEIPDLIAGTNDGERLLGRGDDDRLLGRGGRDELFGGDGDDTLDGGGDNDLLHGGAGDDRLIGGLLPEETDTASYANTWFDGEEGELRAGSFGAVQVDLTAGRAFGAQGNDTLEGIENVIGSGSDDLLRGNGGDNALTGGAGNDRLEGLGGNDVLVMGTGDDTVEGGDGDDTIIAGPGNATVDGGAGDDLLSFGLLEGNVRVSLETESYEASLIETIPVWRDDGSVDPRLWNGTVLSPTDVIEAEVSFANSEDDLTRALPGPDDPLADQFEVVFRDIRAEYSGVFDNVERVTTGAGNDTILGTNRGDWMGGGAGNDALTGDLGDAEFDALSGQVFRLYQAVFDRAPDFNGFYTWMDRIGSGDFTAEGAAERFVQSIEFRTTYGNADTDDFVTLLYQNVLGRRPDPTGFASWTERLETGELTRAEVVLRFAESREFVAATQVEAMSYSQVGMQIAFSDDVYRLYRATLDRNPDPVGFRSWTEELALGEDYLDVISGFMGSIEFRNTYGDTNTEEFVTLLYRNVLNRGPDPTGLETWTTRLDSGEWTREDVVQGFARSREFVANTTPDFIEWGRRRGPDDVLVGGEGNDLLNGGLLSDRFVFSADDPGRDQVANLEAWDVLEFTGFGYASAADARANMVQDDDTVVFTDQGVSVVFVQATIAELEAVSIFV